LSARRFGRPLIILARRHALGEHRNDHQLATSRRVADFRGVYVVQDVSGISALLSGDLEPACETDSPARTALITRIKSALLE
ncbi:MAG: glycosyltransferase family 28 protein, partial [Paracoccaceae bacterium]